MAKRGKARGEEGTAGQGRAEQGRAEKGREKGKLGWLAWMSYVSQDLILRAYSARRLLGGTDSAVAGGTRLAIGPAA